MTSPETAPPGSPGVRRKTPDWQEFAQSLFYQRGSIDEPPMYRSLGARLDTIEHERGLPGNRIYYLAVPPTMFVTTVGNLAAARLVRPPDSPPFARLIVEKPIGRDLASARSINDTIASVFDERQIYRIDHYLGKETVQNILVLRFANSIFEPLFNQKYIDHVQITVAEEEGVGKRAGYYEQAGALRDMVQNHILQLVALVATEPPRSVDADVVRDEKLEVIQALRPIAGAAVDGAGRPGAVCRRLRGWGAGAWIPARGGRAIRNRAPRPSWRCRSSSTTGAGRACRFFCAPASGCRSGRARFPST